MTGQELINWIRENHAENSELRVFNKYSDEVLGCDDIILLVERDVGFKIIDKYIEPYGTD